MKSGPNGKRNLLYDNLSIKWKHLADAYEWDQANSLKIHQKLSPQHFELDSAGLMRNHYAEQVLDKDMLRLMKVSINRIFKELN